MTVVFVAVGGFFGAIMRFALSQWNGKSSIPLGTLLVNLLGSFLLGMLISLEVNSSLYALFGIGFLGAFTTFSTFNKELFEILQVRKKTGIYYICLSYGGGITLAFVGFAFGTLIV